MAASSPFEVLGISPDAEPEVIQAAYRALARKYHPDVNHGVPPEQLNARMKQINWAKQELERDLAGWRQRVRAQQREKPREESGRAAGDQARTRTGRPGAEERPRATYASRKRRSPAETLLLSLLRPIARTGFRF